MTDGKDRNLVLTLVHWTVRKQSTPRFERARRLRERILLVLPSHIRLLLLDPRLRRHKATTADDYRNQPADRRRTQSRYRGEGVTDCVPAMLDERADP